MKEGTAEYPAPAALPKEEEILQPHTPESPGLGPKNPLKKKKNPDDCNFHAIPTT